MELLIWTRFTNRLFKIEPETRATKTDETHHVQMRRTLSAVFFPTERPCVFALGTAEDSVSRTHISGFWSWILWHQRDSGPLQQVTSVTRSFCSTPARLSATLRSKSGVYAHECDARWPLFRAAIHPYVSISATSGRLYKRVRLLTKHLQVCTCARKACRASTWVQAGCEWNQALNCLVGEIPINWV